MSITLTKKSRTFYNTVNMADLKQQIKELIINALEIEDIKPENIDNSAPLFGEGLGLDSIDALELGIALKKKFGINFSAENADNKKHFASVDALAAYIEAVEGTT
jgi:acyl carrier protein